MPSARRRRQRGRQHTLVEACDASVDRLRIDPARVDLPAVARVGARARRGRVDGSERRGPDHEPVARRVLACLNVGGKREGDVVLRYQLSGGERRRSSARGGQSSISPDSANVFDHILRLGATNARTQYASCFFGADGRLAGLRRPLRNTDYTVPRTHLVRNLG